MRPAQTAQRKITACLVSLPALALLSGTALLDLQQPAAAQEKSSTLTVVNYVSGWAHDMMGYHPAVYLLVENTSGRDLSGKLIRFQGRFTDLDTAEVTVGRKEVRRELKPHQQLSVSLQGPGAFDLPFEVSEWPTIECKVMSRIGNVSDEGTETLLISKLEQVTHTTDEAFNLLNQASSFRASTGHAQSTSRPHKVHEEKRHPHGNTHAAPAPATVPVKAPVARRLDNSFFTSKSLPGLGDDFFQFEQHYGLPVATDAKSPEWTWAQYRHAGSGADVVAGARGRSGAVDFIMVRFPPDVTLSQTAIAGSAKALAGNFKTKPIGPVKKSVRYLPSGRIELETTANASYKVVCWQETGNSDSGFILVISRLPQDLEHLMSVVAQKSELLKPLRLLATHPAR